MTTIVRPYIPDSWFHPIGIKKKVSKLMPKLPDVTGCLFITLTIDRNQFSGPESAYDFTREKIRRMFDKLRKGVEWEGKQIVLDAPTFVKVEFHEDGWAHYHIIFKTRRYFPGALLRKLWPWGRPNVKRIRNKTFHYLLKYVTKGGDIPEWVLRRERIRIIQPGHGFYVDADKKSKKTRSLLRRRKQSRKFRTIGERLKRWERMILIEHTKGTYTTGLLSQPYVEFLGQHIIEFAQAGLYLGNQTLKLTEKVKSKWKIELMNSRAVYSLKVSLSLVPVDLSLVRMAREGRSS